MSFPRLFSPLVIGPVVARNRVVCGAHFTMYTEPNRTYGEPGFYGERYGRYLAEYARGGVGTVIAGQAQVHPTTAYQMHNNAAVWDPACVPHLRRVSEQIQRARRARVPAARAQRRREPRDVVAAAGVVGVGHREPHGGVEADRPRARSARSSSTSAGAPGTPPTPASTASRSTPRTAT